jgi:hypothetical protein
LLWRPSVCERSRIAPQLKRDSLGGALNKLALVVLGFTLGGVQADIIVAAKGNVVTPNNRPVDGCAVAIAGSREPPREAFWWRTFRGHFSERTTTSSTPTYVHVRCKEWRPVVRRLVLLPRGWSSDSVKFVPWGEPVDLGTITLQPTR